MSHDQSQSRNSGEANGLKLGEFLFFKDERGILRCHRHGLPWRDFIGDHAINSLFDHALRETVSERGTLPGVEAVYQFLHPETSGVARQDVAAVLDAVKRLMP